MKRRYSILLAAVLIIFTTILSYASVEFPAKTEVPLNKDWTIKFNMDVDESTITEDNVYILDSKGNKHNCELDIPDMSELDVVKIIPEEDYLPNEKYTLYINDIRSLDGIDLNEDVTMHFNTIKNDADINKPTVIVDDFGDLLDAVELGYNPDIKDKKVKTTYNKALEIVEKVITEDMTDFEKEQALYDFLVLNCEYDYGRISDDGYNPYGPLIEGIGVCSGYAKSMKLLLNMVGIECILVSGEVHYEGHAWNIVNIEGEYYHLDPTWGEDFIEGVKYNYFNVSDNYIMHTRTWDTDKYPACDSFKYNYDYYNYCQDNNLALDNYSRISGSINLPYDVDYDIIGYLYIEIPNLYSYKYDFKIPAGKDSMHFNDIILPHNTENNAYNISYTILSTNTDFYMHGDYNKDIDISKEDIDNIEIQIGESEILTGVIYLPNNEVADERIYGYVTVYFNRSSHAVGFCISEGENSTEYSITLPPSKEKGIEYKIKYELNPNDSGYIDIGYYNKNGIVTDETLADSISFDNIKKHEIDIYVQKKKAIK